MTDNRFTFSVGGEVREHSDDVLFLADASATDWARIFMYGEPRAFDVDDVVVHQGENDRALYFLTEGTVRVMSPDGKVLKAIDAPSVLGELAFLDGQPRSVELVGAGEGQVVRFDVDAYEALSAEDAELGRRIALDLGRVTALRLRMAERTRNT